MKLSFWLAVTALTALAPNYALAQGYPTKPVRLVVPFAPGGTTDVVARITADALAPVLGQPVVIENKSGGGGAIGAMETVRATPDGYALGLANTSTTAANPAINPKPPYNPLTDFTPIVSLASSPNILAVTASFPAKDYKGFIDAVRKNPGKFTYASSGIGANSNLQMELFKMSTGTFITHVPYRGSGPALTDTVSGQVSMILDQVPTSLPFIRAGKLVPIAVAAPARLKELPDVPTFKELGLEQVNRMAYYGIYGPKGLPEEVVKRVHEGVVKAYQDPAVRKRIEETGSIVNVQGPDAFKEQIRAELAIYRKVVETMKLKAE
jgi:tripartite-type tricarboxylate transporter receptor subunit TctC